MFTVLYLASFSELQINSIYMVNEGQTSTEDASNSWVYLPHKYTDMYAHAYPIGKDQESEPIQLSTTIWHWNPYSNPQNAIYGARALYCPIAAK